MGYKNDSQYIFYDKDGNKYELQMDYAWGTKTRATAERFLVNGTTAVGWDNNLKGSNSLGTRKEKFKEWAKTYAQDNFSIDQPTWYASEAEAKASSVDATDNLSEGTWGDAGLTKDDFKDLDAQGIADLLTTKGLVPAGMTPAELLAKVTTDFPQIGAIDPQAQAGHDASVAEDVYGFETDIARAKEDIGTAGESSRSDIYGLQGGAAQKKRAGMFGKGLGGGMSQLNQQDTSSAMRASGQGIMEGLTSTVQGKNRDIQDANTGLYGTTAGPDGIIGTADDVSEAQGGVLGAGGSKQMGQYGLQDTADGEFDTGVESFLSGLVQG